MVKLWRWLDANILFLWSVLLVVFIPLYPKLPLMDLLPGYIVRLRLEDLLVAAAAVIYAIWWLRKKVNPFKNPLAWLILIYLLIGAVSGLSAVLVIKTIPLERLHLAKWGLHWARRVEYMFLLFLLYDGVKTKRQLKVLISLLMLVVLAACIYGFGQKYYRWPVYSTMNREFAKGWRLVLTEHARVPSTFAGHYDLAAYLVLVLPISLGLALTARQARLRLLGWSGFVSGYTLLILTASRSSFISYLISLLVVFGALFWLRDWKYLLPRYVGVFLFSGLVFLSFGELSGRFAHLVNLSKFQGYLRNDIFNLDRTTPENYLTLTDELALIADRTDIPPVPFREGSGLASVTGDQASPSALPPDVYERVPELVSTISATGAATFAARPRRYSEAAFTYGLSSAIRFDALWPMAWAGFKRNPLLGSGYSTLSKVQLAHFTEAESTDNDYLRALGETGVLGFGVFFGTIGYALILILKSQKKAAPLWIKGVKLATVAGVLGLLVNASYIDVFEASKVAFTFWSLLGAVLVVSKIDGKTL